MKEDILLAGCCVLAIVGCGGRVDVAELDREDALQRRGSAPPTQPLGPTAVAPLAGPQAVPSTALAQSPTAPQDVLDHAACFDSELAVLWAPPPDGGLVVAEVPSGACTFSVSGDDDECSAEWACCGELYAVEFSRTFRAGFVTTRWASSMPVPAPALVAPDDGQTCPLFDLRAASVMAEGFSYSPAWETAVREALGLAEGAPALDPIPLGCDYAYLSACTALLACSEHTYQAGYDEAGELACARDGVAVLPVAATDEAAGCVAPNAAAWVPADQCFGPGWSAYFQLAAE